MEEDKDLFWIAREGLKIQLPENWKPCKTYDTNEIYSLDNTLWNKNSEKLENYLSFTIKY